jgi:xanthine dehydrogenase YagR molybdenum-binding subunit
MTIVAETKRRVDGAAQRHRFPLMNSRMSAVNADVQTIEVLLVPETDDWVNPLGVKGLGELGNVGLNAAVANAVFHATGKRVRDLPVRIEKLMA